MTKLSVNVNKVALLRNSRQGQIPSPAHHARLALEAGAAGITVHPRPDERHIRRHDVTDIAALLDEPAWAGREFNIEGNPLLGHFMELVEQVRPDQVTLVPDSPEQSTSDHGWALTRDAQAVTPIVAQLQAWGCRVSLFMDPDLEQIDHVLATGAERIELYTESWALAHAVGGAQAEQTHARFAAAAARATELGLGINAGHDLNRVNLGPFLRIPHILEVSIGHALVADALELGMTGAVQAYLSAIAGGGEPPAGDSRITS